VLTIRLCNLCQKEISAKGARKMLVKLTTGLHCLSLILVLSSPIKRSSHNDDLLFREGKLMNLFLRDGDISFLWERFQNKVGISTQKHLSQSFFSKLLTLSSVIKVGSLSYKQYFDKNI